MKVSVDGKLIVDGATPNEGFVLLHFMEDVEEIKVHAKGECSPTMIFAGIEALKKELKDREIGDGEND